MAIVIRVTLVRAAFHGLTREGRVQWPPDPVRLLGALKSGAHAPDDPAVSVTAHDALNRLLDAPPPIITTPLHVPLDHPDTHTDRTGLPDKLSSTYEEKASRLLTLAPFAMDSSNRDAKPRDGVALAGRILEFEIDVDLTPDEAHALDAAARHIAYFGRSEDAAIVEVLPQPRATMADDDTRLRWYPSFNPRGNSRGWQANTIAWMDENHARVFSDDPTVSSLPSLPPTGYVRPLTYSTDAPTADQFVLTVVRLPSSRQQHQTPTLLRRVRPHVPSELRILPLTASSHPNSDGRLVGLGIYPGGDAATGETQSLLAELREVVGVPPDDQRELVSLKPETWTGPARRWTSTTPLRGFPQLMILEYALRQEAQRRFSVDVGVAEASTHARTSREHRWANSAYTDGLALWWVTLEFARPITGPLQLGASTEDGFGAFLPSTREQEA